MPIRKEVLPAAENLDRLAVSQPKVKSVLIMLLTVAFILSFVPIVMAREETEPQVMIVFLFLVLFIGASVTYVQSRFAPGVPYTVLVFACGAALSFMFTLVRNSDTLKQSEEMWNNFQPHLLLFVFLPALLFGEAMSLNFHHVRGAVGPSTVLAGPGALFGALLTAVLVKYTLPYEWDWPLCLVFGAILCATDPVAVVALLKSAGASSQLTYLIIGEALMNDGTALVLYNLFYALVEKDAGPVFTPVEVLIYFLRVIFISPLLGLAFGSAAVLCLSLVSNRMKEEDTTVQLAITICCAYLSFFVAEYTVGVSGVLCCCAAALTLSRFANPLILRPETLHSIWAAFEWIGNTLVFILAGLIIGSRTIVYMHGIDVLYILLVYVYTFVIRAVMMVLLYPFLQWRMLGKTSSPQDCIFATWGGLRGAVSMALALALVHSTEAGETTLTSSNSHEVFFLTGGVAALTLVLNATTASWLLSYLGLLEASNSPETKMMFEFVKKRIRIKAEELLEQLKQSRPDQISVQIVTHYCSILRDNDAMKQKHTSAGPIPDSPDRFTGHHDGGLFSPPPTMLAERMRSRSQASATSHVEGASSLGAASTVDVSSDGGGGGSGGGGGHTGVQEGKGLARALFGSEEKLAPHVESDEEVTAAEESRSRRVAWDTRPAAPTSTTTFDAAKRSDQSHKGTVHGSAGMEMRNVHPSQESMSGSKGSFIDVPKFHSTVKMDVVGSSGGAGSQGASLQSTAAHSALTPHGSVERNVIDATKPEGPVNRHKFMRRFNSDVVHDDAEHHHAVPSSFARPQLLSELMTHIRRAFLDVVRVSYWRQINSGKLPRKSSAALILLNSIDVAMEQVKQPGLHDWDVIEKQYAAYFRAQRNYVDPIMAMRRSFYITRMGSVSSLGNQLGSARRAPRGARRYATQLMPEGRPPALSDAVEAGITTTAAAAPAGGNVVGGGFGSGGDGGRESNGSAKSGGPGPQVVGEGDHDGLDDDLVRVADVDFESDESTQRSNDLAQVVQDHQDAQIVYLLTAFIDAHNYAQKRIPFYLGDTETIDTPEEALVVQESRDLVAKAKARLAAIDHNIVVVQVSKQTARWIVHRQEDQIEEFLKEGIITAKDAECLFHEAEHDLLLLGKVEWTDVFIAATEQLRTALDCSQCFQRSDTAAAGIAQGADTQPSLRDLRNRRTSTMDSSDRGRGIQMVKVSGDAMV